MTSARVRIGKVTLKGGAELRIYERPIPSSPVTAALRKWSTGILNCDPPPDAIACASFVFHEETGQYWVSTTWWSSHPRFPISMLPDMTRASLIGDMTEAMVEGRIMRNLGYRPVDPDGAA
jgi:hypothetical protein